MASETTPSPFPLRLRQARVLRGLSLRELSERIDNSVSHVALAKYEQDKIKPSGELLAKLCAALELPPEYFFRPHKVSVEKVNFRRRKTFGEKETAALLENVRSQLENYLEAEEIVGDRVNFELNLKFPKEVTPKTARVLASQLRADWLLGDQPIPSLVELFEKKGIRVIEIDEPSRSFDGCQIEGYDAIAIGKRAEQPVTRKRFTLAHEFGHIVLNIWLAKLGLSDKEIDVEKIANPFASEFLLPTAAVRSYFGNARTSITQKELESVKLRYGISILGIVYALHELEIVGDNAYRRFQIYKNTWRRDGEIIEPGDEGISVLYSEDPSRFQRIVLRGVSEGNISLSRGASLLGSDISDLRKNAVPIVE